MPDTPPSANAPERVTANARFHRWQTGHVEARQRAVDRVDRFAAVWASVILVTMFLYLLIGSTPYQHDTVLDPRTGVAPVSPFNRYFWIVLLGCALPLLWVKRSLAPQILKRIWPLIGLYAWFIVTTRWAIDPAASSRRMFLYVVQAIICVAVCAALDDSRRIHRALAIACAVVIVIDLVSWIVAPGQSMTDLGLAAIHTHKNTLGAVMLLSSMLIAPYALVRPTLAGRLAWSALWVASFILLVASRSKTSIAIAIGVLVAAPLLARLLRLNNVRLWTVGLLSTLLVAALLFAWIAYAFITGVDPLGPVSQLTFTKRTDVWSFSLRQGFLHPFTGVGFGSFWDVDPSVQPSLQTDEWFAKPDAYTNESHNGYIDLFVTTGVIGLAGALLLLIRWMVGGLTLLRQSTGAPADLRAYLLFTAAFPLLFFAHNFMESSYFNANTLFGALILLVGVNIDLFSMGRSGLSGRASS